MWYRVVFVWCREAPCEVVWCRVQLFVSKLQLFVSLCKLPFKKYLPKVIIGAKNSKKVLVWADKTKHKTQTGLPVGAGQSAFFRPGRGGRGVDSGWGKGGLLQSVLNGVVGNHLFFEDVSAGFGRLNHLDNFAVCAAFTFLERGDGFLCHISGGDYLISL